MVDGLPDPGVPPRIEVALHRRIRREVLRFQPPLAGCLGDIEDRIDEVAHPGRARPPARRRPGQTRLDDRPFGIGGVACIAQPVTPILGARDLSSGHWVSPRCLRKHERVPAPEVTQRFSPHPRPGPQQLRKENQPIPQIVAISLRTSILGNGCLVVAGRSRDVSGKKRQC